MDSSSQEFDIIITHVAPSSNTKNPTSDLTIDLSSRGSSVEPLSTPPTKQTQKPVTTGTPSLTATSDTVTNNHASLPWINKESDNLTSSGKNSPLYLNSPFSTSNPSSSLNKKSTLELSTANSMVRPRSNSVSSSDESIFSRPSPAKQQKSITSTPKSSLLSSLKRNTKSHSTRSISPPKKNLKITDFFLKSKSAIEKPTSENDILNDILKTSIEEDDYYKDLDRIQEIQFETKREQEQIRLRHEHEAAFKRDFTAELALRLQAHLDPKTPFGLPHKLIDPDGQLKPIQHSQTFYPLNFEEELKINLTFYKNNSSSCILLDQLSNKQNNETTRDKTDFYFFQPQFRQQHYQLSPHTLKTLPKNMWYSFLSQVETPNLLIESGILMARIRASKSNNNLSSQPLPFVLWMWIMCNALRSKLLFTHYQKYCDCLVESYDADSSIPHLFVTLQTIFLMVGGSPDIVTDIFKYPYSNLGSFNCNIQGSFQHRLSPKGHDYIPQAAAIELIVDVAVRIVKAVKEKSAYLVHATFIAVGLASVDTALLSVSRTVFTKNHTSPSLFFSSKLAELLDLIPAKKWKGRESIWSWATLSELLVEIVPREKYELRTRFLNVLSGVNNERIKLLKSYLALRFLVDAGPVANSERFEPLIFFTPVSDLLDINTIVSRVLIPSIDSIFSKLSENNNCHQTPVLYKIHYMNHCLHNVSALNTSTAKQLVQTLELKADNLTRQMRVSNPEVLLQIGIIESTLSSLRSRLPAYDVFSAV